MKMFYLTMFGLCFLHFTTIQGYRTFSNPEAMKDYCKGVEHIIINPTATCCKMTFVEPGINFKEKLESCSESKEGTAQQASWNVYSCIVKEGDESKLSLSKFAEMMTSKYPEEIKSKIIEEAGTVGELTADLSDFKSLDKLRITYYDIEKEVCKGMPSETKEYGKVRNCEDWDEDIHRGGRCCDKSSFPFDIEFNTVAEIQTGKNDCREKLADIIMPTIKEVPKMALSNLAEICDLACEMIDKIALTTLELAVMDFQKVSFNQNAKNLLAPWISEEVKEAALQYAMSRFNINATIQRIREYEFADSVGGNSSTDRPVYSTGIIQPGVVMGANGKNITTNDFMGRKFPNNIIHIPIHCAAYKEILAYMEIYLHKTDCASVETSDGGNSDSQETTENSSGGDGSSGESATESSAER